MTMMEVKVLSGLASCLVLLSVDGFLLPASRCTANEHYKRIVQLISGPGCFSANSSLHILYLCPNKTSSHKYRSTFTTVWSYIWQLDNYDKSCRNALQRKLAVLYRNCAAVPGSSFDELWSDLFLQSIDVGCVNQNFLWLRLDHVKSSEIHNCLRHAINKGNEAYPEPTSDPCSCTVKLAGTSTTSPKPTTVKTTAIKAIPISTTNTSTIVKATTGTTMKITTATPMAATTMEASTTITTTTTLPKTHFSCSKRDVIADIAIGEHIDHPDANNCNALTRGTNEAYVLAACNVTLPSTWIRGLKVMDNCTDIQTYSPISTFGENIYHEIGAQSGILLDCLPDGFMMAMEHCDSPPEILHIQTGGFFHNDPHEYYVIS